LQLTSSNGSALVKAQMQPNESYTADITLKNLDVGYLTKQDTLIGAVSLVATAKGKGLDIKKIFRGSKGANSVCCYKKYNYQNISLAANLVNGAATATANMQDSNLSFNFIWRCKNMQQK